MEKTSLADILGADLGNQRTLGFFESFMDLGWLFAYWSSERGIRIRIRRFGSFPVDVPLLLIVVLYSLFASVGSLVASHAVAHAVERSMQLPRTRP